MSNVKIDNNIPIPSRNPVAIEGLPDFTKLKVGQSFDIELIGNQRNTVYVEAGRAGIKTTIRNIGGNKFRIWRRA